MDGPCHGIGFTDTFTYKKSFYITSISSHAIVVKGILHTYRLRNQQFQNEDAYVFLHFVV